MNKTRALSRALDRAVAAQAPAWPALPRRAAGADAGQRQRARDGQFAALQREHRELHQALFEAAQVQRKLHAPRELRCGTFDIACEIFPVRYLSGDFYDVLEQDGALGLAVGDIAGKGVAAGLWFPHLIGLLRVHAAALSDPAGTVSAINRDLRQVHSEPPTASLFLARLDIRRGELVYCNAGQPPAFLLRRDGRVESLEEGGPLLGAVPEASFRSGRVVVEPGDTLLGYSDGIVECRNDGDDEFGARRLLAAARSAGAATANTLLFSILGAVQDFAGGRPREDDFALLVARRLDEGPRR